MGRVFRLSKAKKMAAAFQKVTDSQRELAKERMASMWKF